MPRFLPLLSLALLAACSPRPTDNPAPVTLDCNVVGSTCLLPWPSSVFTEVDNRTAFEAFLDECVAEGTSAGASGRQRRA